MITTRSRDRRAAAIRSTLLCAFPMGALLLLTGCAVLQESVGTPAEANSPVVAEVAGTQITLVELDEFVKQELFTQQTRGGNPSQLYELRDGALDRLVEQRALEVAAASRGLDTGALVSELAAELGPISDAEIEAFYEENRARLPDASLEELRPSIQNYLERIRPQTAAQKLAARSDIKRFLEPPRLDVEPVGPAIGPQGAAVTIVEFSDFQCPYCRRAGPVMKTLLDRYPEELRVVYRHLPLDFHERARAAAEASACADEQGAFWPFHDVVFENPQALSDEDLSRYATEVGIDAEQLATCLRSGRARSAVNTDVAAAQAAGITGTPAFLVNGILLSGLQPEEAFDRVIRSELARLDTASP